VDEQVRAIVTRLRFLATLPPAATPEFLLPRPKGPEALCQQLRAALAEAAAAAGISAHIVLRHTYATSMLRAGVSLPALMKLGHRAANMTLRCVEITQQDLQREFHLARVTPRHLIPLPPAGAAPGPDDTDAPAVIRHLSAAIRALDLFRQNNTAARGKVPPPAPAKTGPHPHPLPKTIPRRQHRKIGTHWPDM
jgi:hypothetical protein